MPMTEKTQPSVPLASGLAISLILRDEGLAATVSAYLDGELAGKELAEFEALLHSDEVLMRAVAEMRRIDSQLTELGNDILSEPIPDTLLEPFARLGRPRA
jgi:anti-sigma factor RsiW